MKDDTIAPSRYRSGRGDRAIPLGLGLAGALSLPVLVWAAGPFLWPWGLGACFFVAGASFWAFRRWWFARETVFWAGDLLEFRRGKRSFTLDPEALTDIAVRTSAGLTRLRAGPLKWRLTHRLVRVNHLLDHLRSRRPDLFDLAGDELHLRTSPATAALQLMLAGVTALVGILLWDWQPWLGWAFEASSVYALLRALWFIPRGYRFAEEVIVVEYWLRRRRWRLPASVEEDSYAAGGAVFFKMTFRFGARQIVVDEGQLLRPLRPHADWIVGKLMPRSEP